MNLIERMERTQRTVDDWKLRAFDPGKYDCVKMTLDHLRRFGKKLKLPKYGDNASSMFHALASTGCKSIGEVLEKKLGLRSIDPHERLLGDILSCPGDIAGYTGLVIDIGNGRALGFHEEIPHCDIIQPLLISGCWSLE